MEHLLFYSPQIFYFLLVTKQSVINITNIFAQNLIRENISD